ncbi:MAG TPA: hypothetical protein VNB06_04210 [Thermoanaerobaculia bacterium]|nr:hypothetical protein [Thermoanaerobaculia bacterium]
MGLDGASPLPDEALVGALAQEGVAQFWVEWGRLEPAEGKPRLVRRDGSAVPRGTNVVLVTRGAWSDLRGLREEAVDALAGQVIAAAADAEAAGALVSAVAMVLEADELRAEDANILSRLRSSVGGRRALGIGLDPRWLVDVASAPLLSVAESADFFTSHLYGGAASEIAQWDLDSLRAALNGLEALGRPYVVGVSIVGSLEPPAHHGERAASLPLEVLYSRKLVVEPAFSFEGYVRQLLEVQFLARTDLGAGVSALPGERWRLSRPTAGHLDQVLRVLRESAGARYQGMVLRHLRSPDDALGIPAAEVLRVLRGEGTSLELDVSLEVGRRGEAAVGVVTVGNPGAATAAATMDHNVVELSLEGGTFLRVEPGGFHRFQLYDRSGRRAGLRQASRLRLYFRFLERGESLASASVQWEPANSSVTAMARYLTPTGDVIESAPVYWPARARDNSEAAAQRRSTSASDR